MQADKAACFTHKYVSFVGSNPTASTQHRMVVDTWLFCDKKSMLIMSFSIRVFSFCNNWLWPNLVKALALGARD